MKQVLSKSGVAVSLLVAALVAGVLWGTSDTERGVERAVRENFVAAGQLSKLQVEGEKLRRYEKEMFIYVADTGKRKGYMKEFDNSYGKMLVLLDSMLLPSGPYFSDEERKQILEWKQAAVFYAGEMTSLAARADASDASTLTSEQRIGLTLQYNEGIKAGKDRFRSLLGGTEKMRLEKEDGAQKIAVEINSTFRTLRIGVLIGGLLLIGLVLSVLRGKKPAGEIKAALNAR
jgi:hypothetical protein